MKPKQHKKPMNTLANTTDIFPAIAVIAIGLLGLTLLVATIFMPFYVYLIYRQGVKSRHMQDAYLRAFNAIIRQNDLLTKQGDTPPPTNQPRALNIPAVGMSVDGL